MSLLQELHSDKLFLLENTKSTSAQLDSFLNSTGYLLGDVLYRESIFNQYQKYLKSKTAKKIKGV